MKVVELESSKAALEFGVKMKREGEESECMQYLWMTSDLGKVEATPLLADIYRTVKMVDGDNEESRRLFGIVEEGIVYQQAEGFKWGMNQETKALFIKGETIGVGENGIPW